MITRNPGNVTQLFAFDAVAGQRLYFDYLDGSNNPYWRLIDPKANVVFGPTFSGTDVAEPLLPIDGRYTLMIEGRVATSAPQTMGFRSEERRVGKECVSTCRFGWSRDP